MDDIDKLKAKIQELELESKQYKKLYDEMFKAWMEEVSEKRKLLQKYLDLLSKNKRKESTGRKPKESDEVKTLRSEGKSLRNIAEETGLSVNTVRKILSK